MALDTSWAAEVRWQDIGIADAAGPWRADLRAGRRRVGFPPRSSMTSGIPWQQSTQVPKC